MSAFTLGTEASQALFNWTGVELAYPCGFPANQASDLVVQYTTGNPAVTTTLVLGIAYTVALDPVTGSATVNPIAAGMPVPPGTVTITRNTPALEPTQFANLAGINADTLTQLLVSGAMRDAEYKRRLSALETVAFGMILPVPPAVIGPRVQRLIASAANLPIQPSDMILNCNLAAALIVTLPGYASRAGVPLTFKDVGGTFAANRLTLAPAGVETIEGVNAAVLCATNRQSITLVPANDGTTTGWSIE